MNKRMMNMIVSKFLCPDGTTKTSIKSEFLKAREKKKTITALDSETFQKTLNNGLKTINISATKMIDTADIFTEKLEDLFIQFANRLYEKHGIKNTNSIPKIRSFISEFILDNFVRLTVIQQESHVLKQLLAFALEELENENETDE